MKIGVRKRSFSKSLKARTTGKLKRKLKKTVNPLYGKKNINIVKNPTKYIKNKLYHSLTVGVPGTGLSKGGKKSITMGGKATADQIKRMKELKNTRGVSMSKIKYTAPNGEVMYFDTPEQLEEYLGKDDELDIDSIADEPSPVATVYGDGSKRNTDKCPYCGVKFDTPPTRGKKCPKCSKTFYVRVGNRLFASDLLKDDEVWASDCFRNMTNSGVDVEYAVGLKNELKRKWKKEPSPRDMVWNICRFFPSPKRHNALEMVDVAADLCYQLARYELACGRDPKQTLEWYINQNIQQCKAHMIAEKIDSEYIYVFSDYCCDVCRARHGKKIKIDDALNKMPIPFKDCQYKERPTDKYHFCRSYYSRFDPKF